MKRTINALVMLLISASLLSSQTLELPTYYMARNRSIGWGIVSLTSAALAVFGYAEFLNALEQTSADGSSSIELGGLALFLGAAPLASLGTYYTIVNIRTVRDTPRPPTRGLSPVIPGSEDSKVVLTDKERAELVTEDYETVLRAIQDGDISINSTGGTASENLAFIAIRRNPDRRVYRLFLGDDPLRLVDNRGRSLLYYAVRWRGADDVAFLLEEGFDPLFTGGSEPTPFAATVAARDFDSQIVELLLQSISEMHSPDDLIDSVILLLSSNENEDHPILWETTQEIIASFPANALVAVSSVTAAATWESVLSSSGTSAVAESLLDAGLPLVPSLPEDSTRSHSDKRYRMSRNFLEKAIDNSFSPRVLSSIIEALNYDFDSLSLSDHPLVLMALKAYPVEQIRELMELGIPLPSRGVDGSTVLHLIAAERTEIGSQATELFHSYGVELEARNAAGETAFLTSIRHANVAVMRTLLDLGARANVRGENGWTGLHIASRFVESEVVFDELISAGISVDVRDAEQREPLHLAAIWNNLVAIQSLIENGADLWATDDRGWYPFHYSSETETVRLFVNAGVGPSRPTPSGTTLLHISVARSSPPEFVSFLLDLEIDPNSVDDDGMTPLFVVATLGQDPRIGMILIEAGADLSIKTNNGLSAWDMIQSNAALKFSDFYWILNDAEYE